MARHGLYITFPVMHTSFDWRAAACAYTTFRLHSHFRSDMQENWCHRGHYPCCVIQAEAWLGGAHQKTSSKALAKSWPYPKYQDFEAVLHKSAACDSLVGREGQSGEHLA